MSSAIALPALFRRPLASFATALLLCCRVDPAGLPLDRVVATSRGEDGGRSVISVPTAGPGAAGASAVDAALPSGGSSVSADAAAPDPDLSPDIQPPLDSSPEQSGPGGCQEAAPSIAFTFVPPTDSLEDLTGQVCNASAADHFVAVFIKVRNGWWVKPYQDERRRVPIASNGTWTADITTGRGDETATEIRAYLLPTAFDPPIVRNLLDLPVDLGAASLAQADAIR
jgi:hypothetical protein